MESRAYLRRILSFCLAFLLSASVLRGLIPFQSYAADGAKFYAEKSGGAYSDDKRDLVEDYSNENYYPLSEGVELTGGDMRGGAALEVTSAETSEGTFYLVFEETKDLSPYNELYFQLRIDGAAGECSLSMSFASGNATYTVSGEFTSNTLYDVFCPVSAFEERGEVDHVYCSFSSQSKIDGLLISAIYADARFTYSHASRFCADTFRIDSPCEITEDAVTAEPADGACAIEAPRRLERGDGWTVIARVSVSGVDSGTMTFSVKGNDAKEFSDISTINLFPGENAYTFIYAVTAGDDSYRLLFSGVTCTDGKKFSVNSVSFSYYIEKSRDTSKTYPASISGCSVSADGTSVSVKGTVASSFVVNHIDGELGVVAYDIWDSSSPVIAATADMSTLVDIRFPASSLEALPDLCRYGIALIGEDGKFEPISAGVFPYQAPGAVTASASVLGIESDDTSAPFDANASFTLVDVDPDMLIGDDPSGGRFHSYAGSFYYVNTSYEADLEKTLGFYVSSGLNVYVRIFGGYGAHGAFPDAGDKDAVMKYAAAVDYLTKKYPSIHGIVVGSRINMFIKSRSGNRDLFRYAENYSNLFRIMSAAARANNPSCTVAVPFGDGHVYDNERSSSEEYDAFSGVGGDACDPMLLSVLISRFFTGDGGIQWYMMYECASDPASNSELLSRAVSRLIQNVGSAPSGYILYWRPDREISEEDLSSLSVYTSSAGAATVTKSIIVSLVEQSDGRGAVSSLKHLPFDPEGVRDVTLASAAASDDISDKGHVFIKDFRRSYGSGSFFAGGAFTSLATEKSDSVPSLDPSGGERAIRAVSDGKSGGSGILMTLFDTPLDVSSADDINVALCVSGDEGEEYPVSVVVGNGGARCEYSFTARSGEAEVLKCDTGKIAFNGATYLAIEVLSGASYTLDVSRISLSRNDGDEGAIRGSAGETEEGGSGNGVRTVTAIAAIAVFTLMAFALLSIKGDRRKSK